tara:strand:- start:849 stop:1256 length:408 start_codon:yes stop_codon:yes gene_type:complete
MIKFMDDNKDGDAWVETDKYSIWIEESASDGSIRIEVVLGDHLGQAVANLMVSAPREAEPAPKPKQTPYQQRAVNAILVSGISKRVLAIMMDSCERSITYWSTGKSINGPNLERLEGVVDALKVSVPRPEGAPYP